MTREITAAQSGIALFLTAAITIGLYAYMISQVFNLRRIWSGR